MTEFADRLREATIALRPAYAEQLSAAVKDVADLQSLRAPELLSFARATFPNRVTYGDLQIVSETFQRRNVAGDSRMRQLWSTLAGLVLISRFERGPGKRSDARIAAESVAAVAIEVLANQGLPPVHPDVVTHATRWNVSVAEHLRARGRVAKPTDLPPELASVAMTEEVRPSVPGGEEPPVPDTADAPAPPSPTGLSAEQATALVRHIGELTQWVAKSSSPARLEAFEEQQALLWWLESAESKAKTTSGVSIVVRACEELIATTRFFPGPPAATELLKRRLGSVAAKPLSHQALAKKAARDVPSAVADVCSLLNGVVSDDPLDVEVRAIDLAAQLYTEMVLLELVRGTVP